MLLVMPYYRNIELNFPNQALRCCFSLYKNFFSSHTILMSLLHNKSHRLFHIDLLRKIVMKERIFDNKLMKALAKIEQLVRGRDGLK